MTSNTPGPTGDEIPEAGEAAIPAGQRRIAATAGGRRTSLFAALKGGRLKTAAELATILSLVVAIIAVVQTSGSSNPTPATAPGQDPTDASPEFIMFDDFNGSEINTSKWKVSTSKENTDPPYVKNGKLHLRVTQQDGKGNLSTNLQARLQGAAITNVSFEMALEFRKEGSAGGGYAKVLSEGGRQHKLALKPGSGSPNFNYYICEKTACSDKYDDFDHPRSDPIRAEQTYLVHIYQDDHGWIFEVDGFPPVPAPGEDGPIDSLEFSLFSHGEPFHVTVDNVRVTYA